MCKKLTLTLQLRDGYYGPAQSIWTVMAGNTALGLLEKWRGKPAWLAYIGVGFDCRYLGGYATRAVAMRALRKAVGL